jgi:probable HAF family extracellular repeat protein
MSKPIHHTIASLAIAASITPASAGAISFTPLGDLTGGDFNSAAYAISNDGTTVVGASSFGVTNDFGAFHWTLLTGMVPLTDLPTGGFESGASAVDADGSVIAGYGTAATTEAASWTSPLYAPTSLGTLGGANPFSRANGISADGSVIVGETSTAAGTEAFVWTSGGMVSIGDFPTGGTSSVANAVSDDGSVVVGGGLHAGPSGEAFRWEANVMVGLGDLAGGSADSIALGISGDGSTVVGSSNSGNGLEAFVWTVGSGIQPLGDLAGGTFESRAHDASGNGGLIVGYGTDADGQRAVIWSSGTLFDLNVIAAAVLPAGWVLEEAFGISSDGLSIVGRANNPDGNNEAFLLRLDTAPVPEPGTGALLAFGLLTLAVKRHRR